MCKDIGGERTNGDDGEDGDDRDEAHEHFCIFKPKKGLPICFFPWSWAKLLIEL